MSISGQQTINIGLPNESTNSDSLYTAFTTVNTNFNTLFSCASPFTNFVGGTGISTSTNASTGTVTLTNIGVTSIVAGTNITINRSNGAVTISATGGNGGGGGTVTSVGLAPVSTSRLVVTHSPIVSSGVIGIDLATSGAVAGTYTNPSVTVDTYGRVTSITSGPTSGTVTSVGLTAGPGVQINGGPITTAGNIVVTNTGVIKLTSGTGINLSGQTGNITVSLDGSYQGTVTSVGIYSTSLTVTSSPVTTAGTIRVELPENPSATGTFTAGNLTTAGALSVTGQTTLGNLQAGNGAFSGNITAGNISAASGTISALLLGGTLSTAAQPNITSVGTLGSLVVTGNITSGNANLGNNATASFFTGSGQYLTAIQAASIAGTVAAAANSINVSTTLRSTGTYYLPFISATASSNYALNSNAAFSANLANGGLVATTFTGNLSSTGNSNVGNLGFGTGVITGTGNITGGNIIGIVAAGANAISTTGNITGGNVIGIIAAGSNAISTTGNITGGNIIGIVAAGSNTISTTGNITGGNIIGVIAAGSNTISTTGNANVGNLGFGSGVITGTGNITAGNIIGTVAAGSNTISTTGNISGANVIVTSYHIRSLEAGISATGTTQGTATALTKEINIVSAVASGAGVVLPTAVAGMVLIINNTSVNTLAVYPASGGVINSGSTNAAYSHVSGASLQYYATSSSQWYTVGATFA